MVFPSGWILLHRHSGRDGGHGDDNIVYDDDFNDPRIVHYISLDWIRLHRHCGPGYDDVVYDDDDDNDHSVSRPGLYTICP